MKKLLLILLLIPALSYTQTTPDSLNTDSDSLDTSSVTGTAINPAMIKIDSTGNWTIGDWIMADTTLFGDWRFETCGDWIIADSPLFGDWRFETYGEIIYTNIYYFMDGDNCIAKYVSPDTLFIYLNDTTLVIPKERWQNSP